MWSPFRLAVGRVTVSTVCLLFACDARAQMPADLPAGEYLQASASSASESAMAPPPAPAVATAPGAKPTPEVPSAPGAEAPTQQASSTATPTTPSEAALPSGVESEAAAGLSAPVGMEAPNMFGSIFNTQPTHIVTCSSSSGSTVRCPFLTTATAGELNLSQDGSPMPQDRVIFDYNFFNQVPLAPGGIDVNRCTAGLEKTFFDGNCSVEIRVPFATSLDKSIDMSDSGLGLTDTHTDELGNVTVWTKGLLYRNATYAVTAGLGVQVPTAPDPNLSLAKTAGAPAAESLVYEIRNRSTSLLPFLGTIWTPSERIFVQQFLQLDIDTVGNRVLENDGSGSLTPDGTLRDAPFVFYDVSAGYWLFHEPPCSGRFLTGLAGIFELHFDQALSRSNSVIIDGSAFHPSDWSPDSTSPYTTPTSSGTGVVLGGDSAFSFVCVTAGITAEIRDNAFLSVGYSFPLTGGIGRENSNQLQVYFNCYFGPSSKTYRVGPASAPASL